MTLVRAKESFWLPNKQLVSQGIFLDDSHEIVRKHPGSFEALAASPEFAAPVESATSAPGEKRSTVARSRASKSAEKPETDED